jgi:hypothetical protein
MLVGLVISRKTVSLLLAHSPQPPPITKDATTNWVAILKHRSVRRKKKAPKSLHMYVCVRADRSIQSRYYILRLAILGSWLYFAPCMSDGSKWTVSLFQRHTLEPRGAQLLNLNLSKATNRCAPLYAAPVTCLQSEEFFPLRFWTPVTCVPPLPIIEHFPSHHRWRTLEWISMALELDAEMRHYSLTW